MALLAIFGLALAVRLFHVWQMRDTPYFAALMGDARGYDAWAERIAAGDWIGGDVFYQAPLYPYFVGVLYGLFGRDLLVLRIAQATLGAASCVLLAYAGSRFVSRRAGIAAGVGLALYAPAIFFDALIQKSVLDVFFVSTLLALLSRAESGGPTPPARTLLLGVVAGCLGLTRENALILVVVLGVWIWLRAPRGLRTRLPAVGRFAAGAVLVLLPVAVHNYAAGGGFYLTTSQFGPNFYIGNNPGADGTYSSLRFGRGSPEYERADATELAERTLERRLTPAEVSRYWTGRALDFIASQPGGWLRLQARKVALLVNADEMLDTESQESHAEWSTTLMVLGPVTHFGVLAPLAVLGLCVTWHARRRLWVLYAVGLTYALSTVVFYVFARYRYPLVPLLMLFACAGVVDAATYRRSRSSLQLAAVGAAVAAMALLAHQPLLSPTLMRAITETNLGTALLEAGRTDEAERRYRRAIAMQPDYAPAYNNLGVALRAQGRVEEAIPVYEEGLRVHRDYPTLNTNLASASYDVGTLRLEQGRLGEAVAAFEVALRAQPDYPEARNNLGIALGSQGQLDAAIAQFEEALRLRPGFADARANLERSREIQRQP
jgi:tetratricopeptide (TPR) repeat protein